MVIVANISVGIILLVLGLIFNSRPPKNINNWAGYRTTSSMKNQDTWKEANKYSSKLFIIIGAISIVVGLVCGIAFDVTGILISEAVTLILLFYSIYLTEKHLKALFDKEGKRK